MMENLLFYVPELIILINIIIRVQTQKKTKNLILKCVETINNEKKRAAL